MPLRTMTEVPMAAMRTVRWDDDFVCDPKCGERRCSLAKRNAHVTRWTEAKWLAALSKVDFLPRVPGRHGHDVESHLLGSSAHLSGTAGAEADATNALSFLRNGSLGDGAFSLQL